MSGGASSRWTVAAGIIAMGVTMALTGCTGPAEAERTPPVTATPLVLPTASTEPAPTPTAPPPADPADVSTWIVSRGGIGPIQRGAAYPAVLDDVSGFDAAEICTGIVQLTSESSKPIVLALTDDGSQVRGVWYNGWAGEAEAAPSPKTESGIELGSTLDELQSAYPDLVLNGQTGASSYAYGVGDDVDGWINFVIADDAVVLLAATEWPRPPKEWCA